MEIGDFKLTKTINWFCDFLGYDVEVILEIENDEDLDFYSIILSNINNWDVEFFKNLEPMFFAYYQDTLKMSGETEPQISSTENIWQHVGIGLLSVFSHNSLCYVTASGSCSWEEEHGLEIDVDESNEILYVGPYISNGFYENPNKPSLGNYVQT